MIVAVHPHPLPPTPLPRLRHPFRPPHPWTSVVAVRCSRMTSTSRRCCRCGSRGTRSTPSPWARIWSLARRSLRSDASTRSALRLSPPRSPLLTSPLSCCCCWWGWVTAGLVRGQASNQDLARGGEDHRAGPQAGALLPPYHLSTSPPHHLTASYLGDASPHPSHSSLSLPPQAFRLYNSAGCPVVDLLQSADEPPPSAGQRLLCRHPFQVPPPSPLPPARTSPHLPAPPRTSPHLQPQCTSESLLCRLAVTGDQAGLRHALVGPAPARVRVGRRLHAPLPAALPAPCRAPLLCHGAGAIVPTSPQISPLPRSPPQSAREAGGRRRAL